METCYAYIQSKSEEGSELYIVVQFTHEYLSFFGGLINAILWNSFVVGKVTLCLDRENLPQNHEFCADEEYDSFQAFFRKHKSIIFEQKSTT
ncbi:hypothetical protein COB55_02115 [Candidatus Wolfebacteria bacterium]|nr:MAG: hypothetical protein COB55_02115 [Candidatus Wolfebacteria bacterium]